MKYLFNVFSQDIGYPLIQNLTKNLHNVILIPKLTLKVTVSYCFNLNDFSFLYENFLRKFYLSKRAISHFGVKAFSLL